MSIQKMLFWCCLCLFLSNNSFAQFYTDGPIGIQMKVRDVMATFSPTDGPGNPEDLVLYFWGRDSLDLDGQNWVAPGTGCLQDQVFTPDTSVDFNNVFFSHVYLDTVPAFLDLKMDAWEDEARDTFAGIACASLDCIYNTNFCCGLTIGGSCLGQIDSDEMRCDADPYFTGIDYRQGCAGEWFDHGYLVDTNRCANPFWFPRIQTRWYYINGDDCTTPLFIGSLSQGDSLEQCENTELKTNTITADPGYDFVFAVEVNQPGVLTLSTCNRMDFNGSLSLLDKNCTLLSDNDTTCGVGRTLEYLICVPDTYFVVVDGQTQQDFGQFLLVASLDSVTILMGNAGPNQSICLGDSVQIGGANATLGATYSWSPSAGLSDPTIYDPIAFPGSTTTYFLTAAGGGCVITDSVTITVNQPTASILASTNTICQGDTALLTASGGDFYQWVNNGTALPGDTLDSLWVTTPGVYQVMVSDSLGCSDLSGFEIITVNPNPAVTLNIATPGPWCVGDSILLQGQGGSVCDWFLNGNQLPQTGTSIWITQPGTYQVVMVDQNGCMGASAQVTVSYLPPPVAVLFPSGPDTVCQGDSVVMTASGGIAYNWIRNGAAFPGAFNVATANQTGNYQVIVTDQNGCQDTSSTFDLIVNPNPIVTLSPMGMDSLCLGDSIQLVASGGTNYIFLWDGQILQSGLANTTWVGNNGAYQVVADQGGCTDTSGTYFLKIVPLPEAIISPVGEDTICHGDTLLIMGTGGPRYQWLESGQPIGTAINPDLAVTTAGEYALALQNQWGCTDTSASLTVSVLPSPPAVTISLSGGTLTSSAGSGNQWYRNDTLINGATQQMYTPVLPGIFHVVVTGANGCTSISDTIAIIGTWRISGPLEGDMRLVPNPAREGVSIRGEVAHAGVYRVKLVDVAGKVLQEKTFQLSGTAVNWYLPIESLAAGVYGIQVVGPAGNWQGKLLKE